MGDAIALIGALLGFVREVIGCVNGRGIVFELPTKDARASV